MPLKFPFLIDAPDNLLLFAMFDQYAKTPGQNLIIFIILHPHDLPLGLLRVYFMEVEVYDEGLRRTIRNCVGLLLQIHNLGGSSVEQKSSSKIFLLQFLYFVYRRALD